jgi:tryptophanyl-tRNA synthetase
MITDAKRIRLTDPGNPHVCNVYSYYSVFAEELKQEVENLCKKAEIGCINCKKRLAEILIEYLRPIQEKRNKLLSDKQKILDIINKGSKRAQEVTSRVLTQIKKAMGLL